MDYTYKTTDEMDTALTIEAGRQGKTAEELFNIIVTADMGTLVRNSQVIVKEQLYEAYLKADPTDKVVIDVVMAKAAPVKVDPVAEVPK